MPRKKMITVSAQLDPEMYNKFHELSDFYHRPMAQEIRFLIEREIQTFDQVKDLESTTNKDEKHNV